MVYMAKCSGACTSANSNSLSWFKIAETGLISGTLAKGQWGNGLIMQNLAYNVTIPRSLANGEYLIRVNSGPHFVLGELPRNLYLLMFSTSSSLSTRQTPHSSILSVLNSS
jgi:hypothetical protein